MLPAAEAGRFVGHRETALSHAEPVTDWSAA